jgi:hypothetical protein
MEHLALQQRDRAAAGVPLQPDPPAGGRHLSHGPIAELIEQCKQLSSDIQGVTNTFVGSAS